MVVTTWTRRLAAREQTSFRGRLDTLARVAALILVTAVAIKPWLAANEADGSIPATASTSAANEAGAETRIAPREIFIAAYISQPFYYRSDVHLRRPDGTDLELKRLGWDGDALYPPVDGGIRSVEWWQPAGFMIDFLHNKAVSRLGKGAHGRKVANPVFDEVEAKGTWKGQPVPPKVKLTDYFDRLEFTHGHNVLIFTPMLRLLALSPSIRPYVGAGAGVAVPHVEVWHPGEARENRTSEYQYAGPAGQFVAGIEFRHGKWSYFLEYKFSMARIAAALTGDESWKNFNMPGDMLRQFLRWWRSEPPKLGTLDTRLSAHQVAFGAGYWWQRGKK